MLTISLRLYRIDGRKSLIPPHINILPGTARPLQLSARILMNMDFDLTAQGKLEKRQCHRQTNRIVRRHHRHHHIQFMNSQHREPGNQVISQLPSLPSSLLKPPPPLLPINHTPKSLDVIRPLVPVLQIVSMLPNIQPDNRRSPSLSHHPLAH